MYFVVFTYLGLVVFDLCSISNLLGMLRREKSYSNTTCQIVTEENFKCKILDIVSSGSVQRKESSRISLVSSVSKKLIIFRELQ